MNKKLKILLILSILIPLVIAVTRIISGNISFWYDPARDLLLAIDNHQKFSLIGQTSGIPGIFYGPYWIWILSIVLLVFKDPRIVAFIVLTIPYFTIFPFILYKLKDVWGLWVSVMLWLFFMFSYDGYVIHLWNPHLAPVLTLATVYLLSKIDFNNKNFTKLKIAALAGFLAGFTMNFHISFGLGLVIGSTVFVFLRRNIKAFALFIAGLVLAFVPFVVFELRHGFNQVSTVIQTITSPTAVVSEQSGVSTQIFYLFFDSLSRLINIPDGAGIVFFFTVIVSLFLKIKNKKIKLSKNEKGILLLTSLISLSTLSIYLLSKNPVWDYHFIGFEILFLFFLGIISKHLKIFRYLLIVSLLILILIKLVDFSKEISANHLSNSSLVTKQYIVDIIYSNSENRDFGVFTFSNTAYAPAFDYLLMYHDGVSNYRGEERVDLVYLIIPWTTIDLRDDFIDNRTPNEEYETIKKWEIDDGTLLLRRERFE